MENKKFENHVQNLFNERVLIPSPSSWERLEAQLQLQEKSVWKKFRPYLYVASVLLVVSFSLYVQFQVAPTDTILPNEVLVVTPSKNSVKKEYQKISPLFTKETVVSVAKKSLELAPQKEEKNRRSATRKPIVHLKKETRLFLAASEQQEPVVTKQRAVKKVHLSTIEVRAEALLLAVVSETRTTPFIGVKNNEKPLERKAGLKMDPKAILAAIATEEILESTGNRFLEKVKEEINSLAITINTRNN